MKQKINTKGAQCRMICDTIRLLLCFLWFFVHELYIMNVAIDAEKIRDAPRLHRKLDECHLNINQTHGQTMLLFSLSNL